MPSFLRAFPLFSASRLCLILALSLSRRAVLGAPNTRSHFYALNGLLEEQQRRLRHNANLVGVDRRWRGAARIVELRGVSGALSSGHRRHQWLQQQQRQRRRRLVVPPTAPPSGAAAAIVDDGGATVGRRRGATIRGGGGRRRPPPTAATTKRLVVKGRRQRRRCIVAHEAHNDDDDDAAQVPFAHASAEPVVPAAQIGGGDGGKRTALSLSKAIL